MAKTASSEPVQEGVQPMMEEQQVEEGVQPMMEEQPVQEGVQPTSSQSQPIQEGASQSQPEIQLEAPEERVPEVGQGSGPQEAEKRRKKAKHLVPDELKYRYGKNVPKDEILGLPEDGGNLLFGYKDSWAR